METIMLNKYLALSLVSCVSSVSFCSHAYDSYTSQMCKSSRYYCQQVRPGVVVAVPRHQVRYHQYTSSSRFDQPNYGRHSEYEYDSDDEADYGSYSGNTSGRNSIKVDLGNLTWGAYDNGGNLIKSGHVSGGKDYCPDIHRNCRTVTGTFTVYRKNGAECKSTRFPVGRGGAPMPYCMFFHGGYAMHGSNAVPDYNASHGCVRMAPEDAQWLNENFVQVGRTQVKVTY